MPCFSTKVQSASEAIVFCVSFTGCDGYPMTCLDLPLHLVSVKYRSVCSICNVF